MYTMDEAAVMQEVVQSTRRRRHGEKFKAQVIRAAMQPNASIAAVAQHYRLNANKHSTRMKVLVYDGFGIWLAARRLNKGRFVWTNGHEAIAVALNPEQLRALMTGLPWQTPTRDHAICVVQRVVGAVNSFAPVAVPALADGAV
ncbi:IS66 family insertion sequence element accessory protein TnpB [Burkholderia sp. GS2Y]|uniref:IS66 family insertion sequence element accessory protein TnpB n=1 Tax=Burkholderia theae TaxID=3143496 RepID=A0ABU9WTG4_9BURK